MFDVQNLQSLVLDPEQGLRRDPIIPPEGRGEDFEQKYDWVTLAYGAVATKEAVILVCPKLLNFEAHLRAAKITSTLGEHRVKRVRKFRRYDEVLLIGPVLRAGDLLSVEIAGQALQAQVVGAWEGGSTRRCLFTKQRNNDLGWIHDWARHYVRNHGTQAVLIHDNGSTDYDAEAILDALKSIDGLLACRVIRAPVPFGAHATQRPHGRAKFMQSGLLNLARLSDLSKARSVLQCDIDEIAFSDQGAPGLHEAAETSFWGYATAKAYWRAADLTGLSRLPQHGDHILNWSPERSTKEKWCVRPLGLLGRLSWDVHGLSRYQFNWLALRKDIRFLHCRDITTNWKYERSGQSDPKAFADPATAAMLEASGLRQAPKAEAK